ncbi:N-6 DNA methylase [Micromonospora sp. SD12]|uniref:N-6 DNA methylase n=1 Tax=Micromonospora sp. SD12 TaxID=3452216 RepID=UPI003F8BB469
MATPEELVRQAFIHHLHTHYGYSLEQMAQERPMLVGRRATRADILVCRDAEALADNRDYVLVVETKAEHVPLLVDDYWQGESYARTVGCEFLVMHNQKETRCLLLKPGAPGTRTEVADLPSAADLADSRKMAAVRRATKAFTRDEFRKLLHECHSILRDNHKMDPGSAFDEISKVLFIKMGFERTGEKERFTRSYLDRYAQIRRSNPDGLLQDVYEDAKKIYEADELFGKDDRLRISLATFRRIVAKLEGFDLSATSDDVKGIAFERFLGQTFRGELGQFFTPRPVVDFMVEMLDPGEDDLVCDPASGTGGFLIKVFEYVRDKIIADVENNKKKVRAKLEAKVDAEGWTDEHLQASIEKEFAKLNRQLDESNEDSRIGRLSRARIYGSDAEQRAARTSKMNMIMHGDGHGGIYYHDGLIDVGGIFPGRFNLVITNPPFGSNVGRDQVVGATEQARVLSDAKRINEYIELYGEKWHSSHIRLHRAAKERQPILSLFDIGRDPIGSSGTSKIRANRSTETLFVERCINLLDRGGKLGIVLPEGILNNPSMQWLRDYVEGRAKLLAVVSVPHDVFASSKATVKTSLVFLQRFTEEDEEAWSAALDEGRAFAGQWAAQRRHEVEAEAAAACQALGPAAERMRLLLNELNQLTDEAVALQRSFRAAMRSLGSQDKAKVRRYQRDASGDGWAPVGTLFTDSIPAGSSVTAEDAIQVWTRIRSTEDRIATRRQEFESLSVTLNESDLEAIQEIVTNEAAAFADIEARIQEVARQRAREIFDYPVFMAEVEKAGITATGETGPDVPNELPEVLDRYREFLKKLSEPEYV